MAAEAGAELLRLRDEIEGLRVEVAGAHGKHEEEMRKAEEKLEEAQAQVCLCVVMWVWVYCDCVYWCMGSFIAVVAALTGRLRAEHSSFGRRFYYEYVRAYPPPPPPLREGCYFDPVGYTSSTFHVSHASKAPLPLEANWCF